MKYHCDICKEEIEGGASAYIDHTEKHIIEAIKAENPDWVEKDGFCKKCIEYYRKQMKKDL